MFRLLVLSALISLAFGARFRNGMVPMLDGFIVGGQPTTIENFPYQISMLNFNSHRCGGAVVTNTKILTAAHCTRGTAQQNVAVRAGSTNHNAGGVVQSITGYVEHPEYNIPVQLANDIAVMFVPGLTFSAQIQPAALPAQGATLTAGTLGSVSGWGSLTQGGPCCPTVLQYVDVPYVTNAQCATAYQGQGTITNDMLCAGFLGEGGRDACQGDSGGPLSFNGIHHGVVSWGIGCAQPNFPGVYARTAWFRNWIDAQ